MELRQGPTGPGRGARRDALIAAARLRAWLSSGMRSCRAPPGEAVAQEGFAQLKVALPSSLTPEQHRRSSAGGNTLDRVVIGADPHKHSVTIEVVDGRERVLHKGRYRTSADSV